LYWTLNRLVPTEVHYMDKNPGMFLFDLRKKDMDILDDTWGSKLSAKI